MSEDSTNASPDAALTQEVRPNGPHLITNLRIGNVKSFVGEHDVPLAPLTLIYGPNAAGKSTIIQSLMLLAQSIQGGFVPRGPLVDVRDFRNAISGHHMEKELTVGIDFIIEDEDTEAQMLADLNDEGRAIPPTKMLAGMTLSFWVDDKFLDLARAGIEGVEQIAGPPNVGVRASFKVGGSAALAEPNPPPVPAEGFDEQTGPWGPVFLRWRMDLSEIAVLDEVIELLNVKPSPRHDTMREIALLHLAKHLLTAEQAASAALECWVDPDDWEGGFRAPTGLNLVFDPSASSSLPRDSIPADDGSLSKEDRANLERLVQSWSGSSREQIVFGPLKAITELFDEIEREARAILQSHLLDMDHGPAAVRHRDRARWNGRPESDLVHLGPIRPAGRRVYLEDDAPDDNWLRLRRLQYLEGHRQQVNDWLRALEIPYSVDFEVLAGTKSGVGRGVSLDLTDSRTGVVVSLADVGYGVSQVLPIVMDCTIATNSVICVEQPELHLHPRLAANLSGLFVDSVRRGNQVIAETHSENILLRVQRLIRDGKIAAADVAVLYVDNEPETGASVQRLRLDDEGDLLDRWPGGFFDDRLADVLGVSN